MKKTYLYSHIKNMKKNLLILIVISLVFFSCGQVGKSKPAILSKDKEAPKTSDITESHNKYIHTEYVYVNGKLIVIQNGLPRGGSKYTAPNGEVYGYAVFWTRIINETDNPLELKIDFLDSYEVPSEPSNYFKMLVTPDTMTLDKVSLFNYGLTNLDSFLNKSIHMPSSLKRTINSKESSGFYVVKLSSESEGSVGGGDILRTGLILKGQDLFYRVSVYNRQAPPSIIIEKEIHCGKINMKTFELQK